MNSSWRREGDFYQDNSQRFKELLEKGVTRPLALDEKHFKVIFTGVAFRKRGTDAIIREIEVNHSGGYNFDIDLRISPKYYQKREFKVIEAYFPYSSLRNIYTKQRTIRSKSDLDQFVQSLKEINRELQQEVVSEIIFADLNLMYATAMGALPTAGVHLVPVDTQIVKSNAHINPKKKGSTALVDYLSNVRQKKQELWLSTLKEFLDSGEDPNQADSGGSTPLQNCGDTDAIYVLRGYGANVQEPVSGNFFLSALEHALSDQNPNKVTDLTAGTLLKEPSLKPSANLPVIIKIDETFVEMPEEKSSLINKGYTVTTFYYSDGQIITIHFKNTAALTEDEAQALFPIYKDSFEFVPDEYKPADIAEEFKKDFAPSDTVFAECIYHQGPHEKEKKLVAFNHYVLSNCLGRVMAYCGYSAIARDSKFSGAGLMSLLAFRLAFSLKVMVGPDVDVIRSHLAIHFKSMMMFKMIVEECIYPKYKTPFLNLLSKFFFAQMYQPGDAKYVSNRTTLCAVEETHPMRVVGSKPPIKVAQDAKAKKTFDLFELLFEQHFRIFSERLAPMIFCYIALENYVKLCQLGERLGINTNENLVDYAEAVHPLVKGFLGQKTFKRIAPKDVPKLFEPISSLFWRYRAPSLPLTTKTAGLPPPSQKPSSL